MLLPPRAGGEYSVSDLFATITTTRATQENFTDAITIVKSSIKGVDADLSTVAADLVSLSWSDLACRGKPSTAMRVHAHLR